MDVLVLFKDKKREKRKEEEKKCAKIHKEEAKMDAVSSMLTGSSHLYTPWQPSAALLHSSTQSDTVGMYVPASPEPVI